MRQIFAAFALAATLATPAVAASQTAIGMLDCTVAGGVGFVIGSSKDLACTFAPASGPKEAYFGKVKKLGVDIGVTGASYIRWAVFAPANYSTGALAGDYVGASAEATAGLGLGANVLIGGSDRSIALQPVSVQSQQGLNIAVGLASIELRTTQN